MIARRGFRMFELLLVITIFGVIVLVGVSRYLDLGRETRRMGFELLAHNFTAAVAGLRVQWLIQGQAGNEIDLDGIRVLFNPKGWPASAETDMAESGANVAPAARCIQLWQALLQNPAPATLAGREERGERRYHISLVDADTCRYELVSRDIDTYYFDYSSVTGQVLIQVPVQQKVSDL